MRALSVDMTDSESRPYFFWDEDVSVADLRAALRPGGEESPRLRLLGKLLREARDVDVWAFVTPVDVAAALPALGWVLAEISIPGGAPLPGGVAADELRRFVADLIVPLRRAAFPGQAMP